MDKTKERVRVDYSKVLALLIKRIKFTSNRQNIEKISDCGAFVFSAKNKTVGTN
jgi:hypothetical protein